MISQLVDGVVHVVMLLFYKKLVDKKVVLSCSKREESSIRDFSDLRKFQSGYAFKIRPISIQNVMYVTLAAS